MAVVEGFSSQNSVNCMLIIRTYAREGQNIPT